MSDQYTELPVVTTDGVLTVPLLTDLPDNAVAGSVLFVEEDSSLYVYTGVAWDAIGGDSVGGVDSVNGYTGAVTLTKSDVGLGNVDNTSDANKPISTATQSALDNKQDIISESQNQVLYFNSSDEVDGFPGLFKGADGGVQLTVTIEPDNESGGVSIGYDQFNINPIQNSPDREYTLKSVFVNLDQDNEGYSLGTTNNRSVQFHSNSLDHEGSSDIGAVTFYNNYFEIGNGTDPLTLDGGFAYMFGFGQIRNNVTVDGAMQGFIYQPTVASGATLGSNSYTTAFGDFADIDAAHNNYNSLNLSPSIASINNNNGFTAININPTITTLTGNAGVTGIGVQGTYGTFGTGYFAGININPTVTGAVNADGLTVNMNNVTASGTKRAANLTGDVSINGNLSFSGALSIGQLSAFYGANAQPMVSFNPTSLHSLVSGITAPDSVTTANADTIGVNTAMLISLEDDSNTTSGPFQLGFTALALPCVVTTGTNSYIDYMSGTTTAINLSTSTGGTIDHLRITRAVPIPNGVTTVNHSYGFFYHEPFGAVSSDNFSFYGEDAPAFVEAGVKVGGTPGSTDRPDSGLMLHVEGSTQLDGNIGFFGTTPASQQTGGSATATGTYGSTEQTMLQTVYDALRTYGLLT